MERVRIVKTVATPKWGLTLQDAAIFRSLRDTSGYADFGGFTVTDSTNYILDSLKCALSTWNIYDTLNMLTAAGVNATGSTINFIGGTAGRCDDSGHQLATVTVAKTATIPMNFFGITKATAMTLTTGKTIFNDSLYTASLTVNSADSTKPLKQVNVTGNFFLNGGFYIPSVSTLVGGDEDITDGYSVFKKDSIGGDLNVTGADSVWFTDTVYVGGASSAFSAGSKPGYTAAAIFIFNGTGQQLFYMNGHTAPKVKVKKGSKLTIKA
jgi:hypothetical protein